MLGLMQHHALTTGMLIDHAARAHGRTEIVSCAVDGSLERSDWASVAARSRRERVYAVLRVFVCRPIILSSLS